MSQPKALITGLTGQDGSYLAEFLLNKSYEVFGLIRRTSTVSTERVSHLVGKITLLDGDLTDQHSLTQVIKDTQPDEVYNLAAQSFVPTSFRQPVLTGEATALGVTRMLEAVRIAKPDAKFYQASSSEMFGKAQEVPQSETTPFHPRSPYGVAKVYGHWITINYRESYNMFACSGILFNHECISETMPVIVKSNNAVDIKTIAELVPHRRKGPSIQYFETPNHEIWDGHQWTPILGITANKRKKTDPDHVQLSIQARSGIVETTAHHKMIKADKSICRADKIKENESLAMAESFPPTPGWTVLTPELAEFLGLMTADGYVPLRGTIQFTNNNKTLRQHVSELWKQLFLGESYEWFSKSGWNPKQKVGQLNLKGVCSLCEWLRVQLYTSNGLKKVPPLILNGSHNIQNSYLKGYYAGDGLKAGKGNGIKTNSPILAQGLYWLYANQGRVSSVYAEQRNGHTYYQLNIPAKQKVGNKGKHLRKDPATVRKVIKSPIQSEWVFDIETKSGVFCAGIGRIIVNNSPRRGLSFITRKISMAVACIATGLKWIPQNEIGEPLVTKEGKIAVGNLESKRDWGFAGDYVEAMWLMLQQPKPEDFVIGTGQTHSVKDFIKIAFSAAGISNWEKHITVDPRFYRPAEVDQLISDPSKANKKLGWKPKTSFKELVDSMVNYDMKFIRNQINNSRI